MKMRLFLEGGPWSLAGEGGKVRPLARGVLWSLREMMVLSVSREGEEGGWVAPWSAGTASFLSPLT